MDDWLVALKAASMEQKLAALKALRWVGRWVEKVNMLADMRVVRKAACLVDKSDDW
jgi:hypothetical protein